MYTLSSFFFDINMCHNSKYYLKKIKPKEAQQTLSIDSFFVTTKKKKPKENDVFCEVECQTHGDDTDSVATLIESCETEPSCSSSITDSTNNIKNSELDENHPTLVKQAMRRFSSLKYEQSFPWLYYSCIKSYQVICINIVNFFKLIPLIHPSFIL